MLEPADAGNLHQQDKHGPDATYSTAVLTLLDGSFSIMRVAPGTYYVIASQPGYVSPLAALGISAADMRKPDEDLKQKIAKVVPRITVQANLPVSVNVTLERGAAVSGTVLFDDGSPAAGLEVQLLVRKKDNWVPMQSGPFDVSTQAKTDDRGAYRISGLTAQEYLIRTNLRLSRMTYEFSQGGTGMSSEGDYSLPIYSGGAWRAKDAAPFSLRLGEDRGGEDIQIPVNKLHSVRGVITAASDGHIVNSGKISLLYADDKSEAASADIARGDSNFSFSYVPEGDYILRVKSASDVEYEDTPNPPGSVPPARTTTRFLHSYGSTDQAIHVDGDITGLTVAVPEQPAKKAQAIP